MEKINWVYKFSGKWKPGDDFPAEIIFLRPVTEKEGEKLYGKIAELKFIAINALLTPEYDEINEDDEFKSILMKLGNKEFLCVESSLDRDDDFLLKCTVFFKRTSLTQSFIIDWVGKFFQEKGFPFNKFIEIGVKYFPELNDLYRSIVETARHMESKWGMEWWKDN